MASCRRLLFTASVVRDSGGEYDLPETVSRLNKATGLQKEVRYAHAFIIKMKSHGYGPNGPCGTTGARIAQPARDGRSCHLV